MVITGWFQDTTGRDMAQPWCSGAQTLKPAPQQKLLPRSLGLCSLGDPDRKPEAREEKVRAAGLSSSSHRTPPAALPRDIFN